MGRGCNLPAFSACDGLLNWHEAHVVTNELRSFSSLLRRPVSRDGTLSTVFCCLHAWLRALYTRLLWHPALLQLPATLMYSLLVAAGDPVRIRLLDWHAADPVVATRASWERGSCNGVFGRRRVYPGCSPCMHVTIVPTHALAGPLAASKMHPTDMSSHRERWSGM